MLRILKILSVTAVVFSAKAEKLQVVQGPPLPLKTPFLKDAKAEKDAFPVNFNLQKSGGKLLPQKFIYVLGKNGLQVGPVSYREKYINLTIKAKSGQWDLNFIWPDNLPKEGHIELVRLSDNKIIWHEEFDSHDIGDDVKKVQKKSKKGKRPTAFYQWTEKDVNKEIVAAIKSPKGVKACYQFSGENYKHTLCTPGLKADVSGDSVKLKTPPPGDVTVSINGNPAKPQGIIVIGRDADKINFKATLPKGSVIEFDTHPILFDIIDVVSLPDNKLQFRAKGATPYNEGVKFLEDGSWETVIENFRMYVGGTGEIPFYQEIFVNQQLPVAKERITVHRRSFRNTYSRDVEIRGFTPPAAALKSMDGDIKKYENKYYIWKIGNLKKGPNKRDVGVIYGDRDYVATLDVYRQYQMELSARISGVALVETKEILFIGDLIFGSWYESLFGWKDYYLGQQRWGFYLKHFTSLTEVDRLTNFSATSADLKYRLMPGVWEKDATVGLIVGYQGVTFNSDSLPMYGFGGFWARSMPEFFDKIFNIIPWFRYPKWVDMEFITYPMSASNKYQLGTNYILNFHGKMLFTPRFFMEGGMSIRQVQYKRATSSLPPTSGSLLTGTIGFGYNF